MNEVTNDSSAAIIQMVPIIYRKYLLAKTRNQTAVLGGGKPNRTVNATDSQPVPVNAPNVHEILRNIAHYNDLQSILNEDIFGPLQNDSVIIVVQVRNGCVGCPHSDSLKRNTQNSQILGSRIAGNMPLFTENNCFRPFDANNEKKIACSFSGP